MGIVFVILGLIFLVGALVCSIIILIDAFQNEIWKGLLMLVCNIYGLYYALVEFDHENKWMIVLGSLLGGVVGAVLLSMGLPSK